MTEWELSALIDAHDVLVRAYVDSSLTFLSSWLLTETSRTIMRLTDKRETPQAVLQFFTRRIAFHCEWSAVLSGLRSADDP